MPSIGTSTKLIILAGIPGCGKSTWARTFFDPSQIVSTDLIRLEKWPGEPYDHERNSEVFAEFHRRLCQKLQEDRTGIADATSLTAASRDALQKIAGFYQVPCHLVFFTNTAQAYSRNAKRKGGECVPPEGMKNMWERFRETQDAIMGESYASITIIQGII